MMRLASYTGNRAGVRGLANRAIRWWLASPYSHTELVFSDGWAFSCALTDGRHPRFKRIEFDAAKWDFLDLPGHDERAARERAEHIAADSRWHYALTLLAAFVLQPLYRWVGAHDTVCSTVCAAALGLPEDERYSPHTLPLRLRG